ncbi:proline racemase family protein [Nakamurella endophytica]|uniref:Proline racemase n=1 Tax=Nakamurella endophytica TaxID=1748367 RepID=A0A917WN08_9ACTN|nr:proline racemase family protein [Nakamurella endophytica]GGM16334.1 proline racemase [Nakamurella endophytica]
MSWRTVDYHTAGEPFRIVVQGPEIAGDTVLGRRQSARTAGGEADRVRALLCREPRGHAGMYGCYLVPPDPAPDPAVTGVLFWHNDGFSTACGHGTIALGCWAVDEGLVPAPDDGAVDVPLDVPSGRVVATVLRSAGRTTAVRFTNVPSFPVARRLPATVGGRTVEVDVAWGGALYACMPAEALGLSVTTADLSRLVEAAREVQRVLDAHPASRHPTDDRLSGIYGVVFFDELGDTAAAVRQRTVTVFAAGQVDRSPCGSGTSARLALLHADGRVGPSRPLEHRSIVDTVFTGRVLDRDGGRSWSGDPAVVTEVEGMARRTGEHRFVLDPEDELPQGFLL